MNNPFESGHIKNYLLLYTSVVVIMILFFIATTLFNDVKVVEKKVFESKVIEQAREKKEVQEHQKSTLQSKLKLMDKSY